jgi:heat shock protein HslJ
MKKIVFGSMVILLALVLAGCSSSTSSELPGTNWQLSSLGGTPVLSSAVPTLSFGEDQTFSSSDGCNRVSGTYSVSGSSLTFKLGPSTLMACPEDVMKQADAFTKGLSDTASYQMDKTSLVLRDSKGADLMVFAVQVPVALTSGTWNAVNVNNGKEAVVGLVEGSQITAIFKDDGTLSGSGGCNNYSTTYTTDGNKIKIQPAASTMMACEDDIMTQEFQYLQALEKASVYSIQNNQLEFRDDSGAMQVLYNLE